MTMMTDFHALFDPDHARTLWANTVEALVADLRTSIARDQPVLPHLEPDALIDAWSGAILESGGADVTTLIERVVRDSHHLHHPGYVGHQVGVVLPLAACAAAMSASLNNGGAVFEMGPVSSVIEHRVLSWMAAEIGWSWPEAGGVLTSGGSLGTLTALLAARQALQTVDDPWQAGTRHGPRRVVLVSEQAHYCVDRAVRIMGLGAQGVVKVATDEHFAMSPAALEATLAQLCAEGAEVLAVVASACTTATGSYDPLESIADVCEAAGVWMHVDGAHGVAAVLSAPYRHLVAGLHRADSVVWDVHKMMMMPALTTAVLFKNFSHSTATFAQRADYLFADDAASMRERYDIARRTVECTKWMMGLPLTVCLEVYGIKIFRDYVTHTYALAQAFADMLEAAPDFELAIRPQSNIVCFRHRPEDHDSEALSAHQVRLRRAVIETGRAYLVQTRLRGEVFLRTTLMNPLTTPDDLSALLEMLRSVV